MCSDSIKSECKDFLKKTYFQRKPISETLRYKESETNKMLFLSDDYFIKKYNNCI